MSKKIIMFTGGGTAGHITPVLAVAQKLNELDPSYKFVYVIERNNPGESLISSSNLPIKIHRIFAGKYRRFHTHSIINKIFSFKNNLLNIRDGFFVVIGVLQSLALLLRYRPAVLFSKGGYVSVPVTIAATLLRRRFVTHDSDSVPGLANRLTGRYATKNAVGAKGAVYPYKTDKIVFTGVPVSEEYHKRSKQSSETAKADIGVPEDSEVLFIGGSTQGAKRVDDLVERIVPDLLRKFPKLVVVHSFGRLNEESIGRRYQNLTDDLRKRLILKSFLPDLYKYTAAADIIVSRAGATALAEIGTLGKACIVIPAAQLAGGHQLKNAEYLKEQSLAIVMSEAEAGEKLDEQIEYLLQHPKERIALGKKLQSSTPSDAAVQLARLIISETRRV